MNTETSALKASVVAGVNDPWRPLWTSQSSRERAPLSNNIDVEIAIVGAGLEGLSLAGELARLGKRVVVVEAARIGSGATGASAGIVAPQLIRQSPNDVIKRLGSQQGEAFLRLLAGAGKRTFEAMGDRRREVGANAAGFIAPAKGRAGARRLATTIEQWQAFRSDLVLLSAEETRRLTGAVGYSAALLDPTGGSLNPVACAEVLASQAESNGVVIYERSPVIGVEQTSDHWHVKTASASVTARQVVLCANGGNASIAAQLRRSVLPLSVCQMATEPLSEEVRRSILPQGHAMTDVEPQVFSIRFDPEGRLITAYPMSEGLREPGHLNELANRRLAALLPGYRPTPLAHAWTGVAWLNSDLLPRIVPIATGLYAVQACNGRGIALSMSIGLAFGRWLANDGRGMCAVPIQAPRAVPGYILARYLPSLLMRISLAGQQLRRALLPRRSLDEE